jgi:uncharacterized Ntn-hydrolase superfamily protein
MVKLLFAALILAGGIGGPMIGHPSEISSPMEPPSINKPWPRRHTFSIVAYDPAHKEWGVGTASKILAVGNGTPWAKAGAGAIATQSATNVAYGPLGLELLGKGRSAEEVIKFLLKDDKNREDRQVGIIDSLGRPYAFTGKGCDPWCGEKIGKNYACLGNLLQGQEVVEKMATAFEKTGGPLAWRIMAALEAGEKAGGDKRGKQSAAIVVVRDRGGHLGLNDRAVDFRVDDHQQPIQELARILALELPRPATNPGNPSQR